MSSSNERAMIEVSAAAEKLEHRRRGWTTEEDKKIKIFNLPKVKKAYFNRFESFERVYDNGFDWSIGCPYILKIGFELLPSATCLYLSHMAMAKIAIYGHMAVWPRVTKVGK